jgi:hypothetical protein
MDFTPTNAPTSGTITADDGFGHIDTTGTITVNLGAVASIVIRDAAGGAGNVVNALNITTDDTIILYAAGYDSVPNFIGDVSVTWARTGDLDPVPAGPSASIVFNPSTPTVTGGQITADYGGGITDSTGIISVDVGALDYIRIENAAGGTGSPVTTFIMTTDDSLPVWAAGYDADGNFINDVDVTWTAGGSFNDSDLSVTGGISTIFQPDNLGTGTITADDGSGHVDATGLLTVNVGTLNYVLIRSASGGAGIEIVDYVMTTDDSYQMWAAGYDADGNYIFD